MMKSLLAAAGAVALTIGLAGGAMADAPPAAKKKAAPVKAEAAPAPAREDYSRPHVGDWGGLYFGVNAGWVRSDIDWTYHDLTGALADRPLQGNSDSNGFLGGHVGIQHQMGRIVVGVEASFGNTRVFGGGGFSGVDCFNPAFSCESRNDRMLVTLGPRLGVTVGDSALLYLTGGYALHGVNTREVNKATGAVGFTASTTHDGWYLGGGLEYRLHDRWIVGIEYLHLDFGDEQTSLYRIAAPFEDRRIGLEEDIIRFRLSYKLGRDDHKAAVAPMK